MTENGHFLLFSGTLHIPHYIVVLLWKNRKTEMVMIPTFLKLQCGVQPYPWGEKAAPGRVPFIADLLGVPAPVGGKPFAELWIGAHPNLPAIVPDGTKLTDFIRANSTEVLGKAAAGKGIGELPFLLKVLSCDQALSIQAHPDPDLAKRLHAKDPKNYPDANPKPEIAIAVTPFDALAQFRPAADIRADTARLNTLGRFLNEFSSQPETRNAQPETNSWLRAAYAALFRAPQDAVTTAVRALAAELRRATVRTPHDEWYLRLLEIYPDDRGALSLYFLNVVHLEPGECIYLGANEPHAYLKGTIIECMANSDNVVRAGLTPKFVDTDVLLNMLTYSQAGVQRLSGKISDRSDRSDRSDKFPKASVSLHAFVPPTPEFQVELLSGAAGAAVELASDDTISLLLVLRGAAKLRTPQGETFDAPRGSIWLWPACLASATIEFIEPGTELVRARPNQTTRK